MHLKWCLRRIDCKINVWKNFFYRLRHLQCSISSLSSIPVELMFITSSCNVQPFYSNQYIVNFSIIDHSNSIKCHHKSVNDFCDRLTKFIETPNFQTIRKIKHFEVDVKPHSSTNVDDKNVIVTYKKLFSTCGRIAQSIYVSRGNFIIDTSDELKTIFHKDLKEFGFGSQAASHVSINLHGMSKRSKKQTIGMLENLIIPAHTKGEFESAVITILNTFDKYEMLQNIRCYTINWESHHVPWKSEVYQNQVLCKILLQDVEKHAFLEKIKIVFCDYRELDLFSALLVFFQENYQTLFRHRNLYSNHFKCYEIEFDGLNLLLNETNIVCLGRCTGPHWDHPIFQQTQTKEYSVDDKIIEIDDIGSSIESFGNIFENVFLWLQKVHQTWYQQKVHQTWHQKKGHKAIQGRCIRMMVGSNSIHK